jgi:hypothetical protein
VAAGDAPATADGAIGNMLDPVALLAALDVARPDYFGRVALDGGGPRCNRMLVEQRYPPLMVYLIWLECTRLVKEIASATIYGSSIDKAKTRDREHFTGELAGRPADCQRARCARGYDGRVQIAQEPEDLLPR